MTLLAKQASVDQLLEDLSAPLAVYQADKLERDPTGHCRRFSATDDLDEWEVDGIEGSTNPADFVAVDQYGDRSGGDDRGYLLRAQLTDDATGRVYSKALNFGPTAHMGYGWVEVPTDV